jgi:hypothetical protein
MAPAIKDAVANLQAAKENLRALILAEQEKCKHPKVIHADWRGSEWGSAFKAQRLCLCCGLEEDAQGSGFSDNDWAFPTLKTDGFHKKVTHNELWNSRFPEGSLDARREARRATVNASVAAKAKCELMPEIDGSTVCRPCNFRTFDSEARCQAASSVQKSGE